MQIGACHGDYAIDSSFTQGTTGLPFVQLLLCTIKAATIDPVPFGTVAYFDPTVSSCPSNWAPFTLSTGRFLLPGYSSKGLVPSRTAPMKPGDDIVHSHTFAASLRPAAVEYEGAGGCCNHGPAHAETVNITGNSSVESTGIPYMALLTCVNQYPSFDAKLPAQALIFNEVACPPGWNVSLAHSGRLLVALPPDGTPGAVFGGASMRPGFTGDIAHNHHFAGSVETHSCGVGLASGCCAHDYAHNQNYPYESISDASITALPYLSAPVCHPTPPSPSIIIIVIAAHACYDCFVMICNV